MTIDKEIIQEISDNSEKQKSVDLSNKKLQYEDIVLLSNALQNNTRLGKLSLRGNQLDDRSILLLAGVLPSTHLLTLDLSDNRITAEGLQGLAKAIKSSRLQHLDVSSNEIEHSCTQAISPCGILENNALTELNLSKNKLSGLAKTNFFERLKASTTLQRLSLEKCGLADEEGDWVADVLQTNHSLLFLNLSENALTDNSTVNIAYSLRNNKTLKTIWLKKTALSNQTLAEFYFTCEVNDSLESVNLMHNKISPTLPQAKSTKASILLTKKQRDPVSQVATLIDHIQRVDILVKRKSIDLLLFSRILCCFKPEDKTPILELPPEIKVYILSFVAENLLSLGQIYSILNYAQDKKTLGQSSDTFFNSVSCIKSVKLLSNNHLQRFFPGNRVIQKDINRETETKDNASGDDASLAKASFTGQRFL